MNVQVRRIGIVIVVLTLLIATYGIVIVSSNVIAAGGTSLRFFGTGTNDVDRVKIPLTGANQAINVGATDFTIEFWMRARPSENPSPTCSSGVDTWIYGNTILDRDIFGAGDYGDYGISLAGGRIAFGTHNGASGNTICSTTVVANDTWHHIAVTRNGASGQLRIFVDGQLDAQGSGPIGNVSYRATRTALYPHEPFLVIGAEKHDYERNTYPSYSGWLDELRVSSGLRYSSAFTRPEQPFASDASTLALYHFDEGSGTTAVDVAGSPAGPNNGTLLIGGPSAGPIWSDDTPWSGSPATTTPTSTNTNTPVPINTATSIPATVTSTSVPMATATNTPVPMSTSTNTPQPTTTATTIPSVPDAIFADSFESGDLSAWSASVTDSGDLAVATNAALSGTRGLRATLDDNTAIYITDDRPASESRYRARFWFDPNTISMLNSNAHYIFYGYTGTSTLVFRIELQRSSNLYQLRATLRNDSTAWTTSNWVTISDAVHAIEIDWRAASASGANNGGMTFWIDGVERAQLNSIDNDTRRIDRVRLGAVEGIDSGTRGAYFFDAFESRRTTYIGPNVGTPPTATATNTPIATLPPTATNVATAIPSATATVAATGNTALRFNGSTSSAFAAQSPGTTPFTIEGWIQPTANNGEGIIVSNGNDSTGWSVELNSGRVTLWVATSAGWRSIQQSTSLQAGRWYHIAVTYSGTSAQIFVDGAASSSATISGAIAGTGLRFGAASGYAAFNGALDEFRMSSGTRYSAAFTRPLPPLAADSTTLGLWRFDEGSGQTVADASGNGNTITLGGSSGADSADPQWVAGVAP